MDDIISNSIINVDNQETDSFQYINEEFQPIIRLIQPNGNQQTQKNIFKQKSSESQQKISTGHRKENQQLLKVLKSGQQKSFRKAKNRSRQQTSFVSSQLPEQCLSDINDKMQTLQHGQNKRQLRVSQSQANTNNISQEFLYNNVQVIQKRKRKGSSIFNKNLEQMNGKITQKQLKQRRKQQLIVTKQILSGKVSIIWIFLLDDITEKQQMKIRSMYHGLSESHYVVPLCKQSWQIRPFLQIPNSLFKIVSRLKDINDILIMKDNPKIVQIYILCNMQKQISRALAYKSHSRKIKGIFSDIQKIIQKAQEQLQNQLRLFMSKSGLNKRKYVSRFPSFIKLSGQDKSFTTLYRANLYGAKNLLQVDKDEMLEEFINLVQEKYGNDDQQKQNFIHYKELINKKQNDELEKARTIIMFYVRQSFYYKILNSMLRTLKTTQQFRPCIFPFNEIYHSIKQFYTRRLTEDNRKITQNTFYRGAKLKKKDIDSLKPNTFIEMLGFMSTSKSIQRAKQFTDYLGIIFVIHVPQMTIPEKYDEYDHGFVDINLHNLASSKFSIQQQVLFNCLNIYRVVKIQEEEEGFTLIHLQYGVIFDLLSKKKNTITIDQRDILLNYQFCIKMSNNIQDQGDVYFLANQYERAIYYYQQKIKANSQNIGKYYYKLGKVQLQCGRLKQAQENTRKSLQLGLSGQTQQVFECIQIYSQNSQICLDFEDFVQADEFLDDTIQLIPQNSFLDRAKKIRQRGQVKIKKGQIRQGENDFFESEMILLDINKNIDKKKSKIKTDYFFDLATIWCSGQTMNQLQEDKQRKLYEIEDLEQQIKNMKDQITQQLIKINNNLRDSAISTDNKDQYQLCVKKAKMYLKEIQKRQTNDPIQKAKIKVLQATVQDYLDLNQSSRLLSQAIKLCQRSDPFDQKVGQYSQLLGHLQKQSLEKFSNPVKCELSKQMQPIVYDEVKQKQVSEQCRKNYQKAINVLLYNNKPKSSPQVMNIKNEIGQLQLIQANYDDGFQILTQVKQCRQGKGPMHSQISKSCLLISKISYARGQLKNSFQNAQEADKTLKKALVKKDQQKYIRIYQTSDILIQTKMHRAKIYLKQLKHDLSLKQLNMVQQKIKIKLGQNQYHPIISDIYQMRGQNMVSLNQQCYLDDYFYKAIKLRQRQIGSYNLANAITYCNYSKYLCLIGNIQQAGQLLCKASQIFSCFSEDHPITWLVYYCYGIYNEKKNNQKQSLQLLKNCLQKAHKRYDRSHITVNKIRFQYGKSLYRMGKIQEAIEQFQQLQDDLQLGIKKSQSRSHLVSTQDDEKITLQQSLYNELQIAYSKVDDNQQNLKISQTQIARCKNKLDAIRKTFTTGQSNKVQQI